MGGSSQRPSIPRYQARETDPFKMESPGLEKMRGAMRERVAGDFGTGARQALASMQKAGVVRSGTTGATMRGLAGQRAAAMGGVEADIQAQDIENKFRLMDALNAARAAKEDAMLRRYGLSQERADEEAARRGRLVRGMFGLAGRASGLGRGAPPRTGESDYMAMLRRLFGR